MKFSFFLQFILARRRAAAKRKKLKNLGKSKSTDTEEEDADEDCGDDGELCATFGIWKEISSVICLFQIEKLERKTDKKTEEEFFTNSKSKNR